MLLLTTPADAAASAEQLHYATGCAHPSSHSIPFFKKRYRVAHKALTRGIRPCQEVHRRRAVTRYAAPFESLWAVTESGAIDNGHKALCPLSILC
eukprot:COSAG02_NODE_738_length_17838_cov_10.051412_14_plen_95_part_00